MTRQNTIFDTSWATSGLSRPAPFGQSLPDTWLKFCVTFKRGTAVKDGRGGTMAGEPVAYMTRWCHVVQERVRVPGGVEGTMIFKHTTKVRLRIDAPMLPAPGDLMEWTDDLCRAQRLFVRNVVSPRSLGDHIMVESELYD